MSLAIYILLIILCGILSALFSGLSLGIMMLDTLQLSLLILISEKDKTELNNAKNARKILPLRNKTNETLVTFITANIMVNSAFSLLLGEITSGFVAFIISTVVITIFGEIIPQSICSRYGLAIGGFFVPLIYFLKFCLYIFVKPISMLLDHFIGKDVLTIYNRKQLKALVNMHSYTANVLNDDEAKMIVSALDFSQYKVMHIMTHIDYVFGIDYRSNINYENLKNIMRSGFSRIPVLNRNNSECIVGLFHIKDLINIWFGINKILADGNYFNLYKKKKEKDKDMNIDLKKCTLSDLENFDKINNISNEKDVKNNSVNYKEIINDYNINKYVDSNNYVNTKMTSNNSDKTTDDISNYSGIENELNYIYNTTDINKNRTKYLCGNYYNIYDKYDHFKTNCIMNLNREKNIEDIFYDLKNHIHILSDNDIEIPIKYILKHIGRYIYGVDYYDNILTLLNFFKSVNNHMVVVRKVIYNENADPKYSHIGIITLEDVIETLLQEEITDEFDFKKIRKGIDIPENFVWNNVYDFINISCENINEKHYMTNIHIDKKNNNIKGNIKNIQENINIQNNIIMDKISLENKKANYLLKENKLKNKKMIDKYKKEIIIFLKKSIYFKYIDNDLINTYIENKQIETIKKNDKLLTKNTFLNYAIILINGKVKNIDKYTDDNNDEFNENIKNENMDNDNIKNKNIDNDNIKNENMDNDNIKNENKKFEIIEGKAFIGVEALGPFNIIELFNNTIEKRIDILKEYENKNKKKKNIFKNKFKIFNKLFKFNNNNKIKEKSLNYINTQHLSGNSKIFVQRNVNILFRKWYTQHIYYNRCTYIAESTCEFIRISKKDYMNMIIECYGNNKVDEMI